MRAIFLAGAALIATPAMAQDHGDHSGHAGHAQHQDHSAHQQAEEAEAGAETDHSTHQAMDHSAHEMAAEQDHAQMDHSGHEGMNHGAMDHSEMDHSQMDHGAMDHSQHGQMDHSQMNHGGMDAEIPSGPPPAEAFEGPAHAADEIWGEDAMVAARGYNRATHGNARFGVIFGERFEARIGEGHDEYLWDLSGWYGTGTEKVVFKSEGEGEFGGGVDDAELQLLWGHAIGPWFDLQAGVRLDVEPETTAHLAVGVSGLAPYMIHVDAAVFLSDEGDLTARVEAEHDMRLTQQLVLQPRIEFDLAAQDIPERGVAAGLVQAELGARLRYEFVPEFAPYIGVEYESAFGGTADIIRAAGEDPGGFVFLVGLRTWF
ncbi:copper resistance protein B [Aurantiacibacter sediminis]|uniref:Copper resistance protein B n=1 Tax=Aurantiacibacter sediminis TaxID=2793064 RepID=A0ABS0N110_9SPHN|nr:copper resistance protein B [Aurantiacibacter sediminis]MBH5321634.1 copper resistance protein B [Aurantiacibacter sediminis]